MVELTEQPTNAYRVLLTRARQGMVIVVPPGEQIQARGVYIDIYCQK